MDTNRTENIQANAGIEELRSQVESMEKRISPFTSDQISQLRAEYIVFPRRALALIGGAVIFAVAGIGYASFEEARKAAIAASRDEAEAVARPIAKEELDRVIARGTVARVQGLLQELEQGTELVERLEQRQWADHDPAGFVLSWPGATIHHLRSRATDDGLEFYIVVRALGLPDPDKQLRIELPSSIRVAESEVFEPPSSEQYRYQRFVGHFVFRCESLVPDAMAMNRSGFVTLVRGPAVNNVAPPWFIVPEWHAPSGDISRGDFPDLKLDDANPMEFEFLVNLPIER